MALHQVGHLAEAIYKVAVEREEEAVDAQEVANLWGHRVIALNQKAKGESILEGVTSPKRGRKSKKDLAAAAAAAASPGRRKEGALCPRDDFNL